MTDLRSDPGKILHVGGHHTLLQCPVQVPADAGLNRRAAAIAGKGSPVPLLASSSVAPSTPAAQGQHAPASAARSASRGEIELRL